MPKGTNYWTLICHLSQVGTFTSCFFKISFYISIPICAYILQIEGASPLGYSAI
jgi:hypothetical protein